MTPRNALITGITGQTGSYLAELLRSKGYVVWGLVRRSSSLTRERLQQIHPGIGAECGVHLEYGDMCDGVGLAALVQRVKPDEVYNLAAQSHVGISFKQPVYTADVNALGTLRLLEACRGVDPMPRFLQASSSEMFGSSPPPQSEETPFHPRSPYACSKVFAFRQVVNYREAYGMHASNAILFNHESPRRGENFVTRKISLAAARIKLGLQEKLVLGNLDAKRDWGYAPDYAGAMWKMLQPNRPGDYVIATGESHSVREFAEVAFDRVGLNWEHHVETDRRYERPTEVDSLRGDASAAYCALGWEPSVRFEELVKVMVDADLQAISKKGGSLDCVHPSG